VLVRPCPRITGPGRARPCDALDESYRPTTADHEAYAPSTPSKEQGRAATLSDLFHALHQPRTRIRLLDADGTSRDDALVDLLSEATAAVRDPGHWAVTFAIHLRRGLVAADVDLDGWRGDAARDALAAWCDREGIPYVITASGRPGHGHVIARPGARRDDFATQVAALGITGQLRYGKALLRPPGAPSRHPGCPASRLIHPALPGEAISALGLDRGTREERAAASRAPRTRKPRRSTTKATPATTASTTRTGRRRALPADVQALVEHGTPREGYPLDVKDDGTLDRSHVIWVLAVHAHWRNWSADEYLAAVRDPSMAGCAKVWSDPSPDRAEQYARRMWDEAAAWVADHPRQPRPDLVPRLAAWRTEALAYPWAPTLRASIMATVEALMIVAQETGSADGFGASVRRLAEVAGHASHDTAWDHVQRLEAAGLLATVQEYLQDGTRTDRYAVRGRVGLGGVTSNVPTSNHPLLRAPDRSVGHDVFTEGKARGEHAGPRGLGKGAWMAYTALSGMPQSLHDLAGQTGHCAAGAALARQPKRTLEALLETLAEHGLAQQTADGWVRGSADLDQVAQILGVAGRIATLRAEHTKDRVAYRVAAEGNAIEATVRALTEPDPDAPRRVEDGLTPEDLAWLEAIRPVMDEAADREIAAYLNDPARASVGSDTPAATQC
jgi:hypothetical protein